MPTICSAPLGRNGSTRLSYSARLSAEVLAPIRVRQASSSAALCNAGSWAERVYEASLSLLVAESNPRGIRSGSVRTMLGTPEVFQQFGRSRTLRHAKRLVEVGSGYSTKFARRAIDDHSLRSRITSIDPAPRAEIDGLCDSVIRGPLGRT